MTRCWHGAALLLVLTWISQASLWAQLETKTLSSRHSFAGTTSVAVRHADVYWTQGGELRKGTLLKRAPGAALVPDSDGDILSVSDSMVVETGVDWSNTRMTVRQVFTLREREQSPEVYWTQDGALYSGRIQSNTLVDKKVLGRGEWTAADGLSVLGSAIYWTAAGNLYSAVLGQESIGPVKMAGAGKWAGAPIALYGTSVYWVDQKSQFLQLGIRMGSRTVEDGPGQVVAPALGRVLATGVPGSIYWIQGDTLARSYVRSRR